MRGRPVKSIILGIIGVFITVYTMLIGLDVLSYQTNKNEIDKHLSRIMKHVLESEYQSGDETLAKQMILQELKDITSGEDEMEVEFQAIDLEKGLLSVKVTKNISMLSGKQKQIVVEKTAIIERVVV